ncbi:MAG: efflux RND transporter permease subunit [Rhodospirillaceae bacterium]|jgi:multidrug efflux pump subunit AcrB|nr:efflux RND transporter permease subunit [Rhodospirillaceae bacterium]MBT5940257.1 efflux RND transporter permease subunit [Rhodospirillaceae bacterium]MBT7267165.1 efflux RND transporter permease subunit [Rhodospirillaceae bacterium]
MKLGISGNLTRLFISSPLTPLLLLATIAVGAIALIVMPREEEPQISVPMVDIMIRVDGLKAVDAVELVTEPLEDIVKGIEGVEHVYSQTDDDQVLVTARFLVGTDQDRAVFKVHEKIRANMDKIPIGVPEPHIIGRGINDVAILVMTLSPKSNDQSDIDSRQLFRLADELQHELVKVDDVGLTYIVGGSPDQIRIEPDPEKLTLFGVTLNQLVTKVGAANRSLLAGNFSKAGKTLPVVTGQTLQGIADIGQLLITTYDGRPVYVKDVADIVIGARNEDSRVWQFEPEKNKENFQVRPAVSIAFAKRQGANAVTVAENVLERLADVRGKLLPENIDVAITRNYGETAKHKANELLFHLVAATITIVLIIALFIGWREGAVVLVVIPATILFTFFLSWLMGFTINRVSLFALIFSIGILVDDAIVVIENIVRHWQMKDDRSPIQAAVEAVAEVGNPTIIATLTIVAALLPMMFVSGLMGPYMSPIPANASAAMLFSFFVAVIITPWLLVKLKARTSASDGASDSASSGHDDHGGVLGRIYRAVAIPLLQGRRRSMIFLIAVGVATMASFILFATKDVTVKLLPFDDKSELQVVVDLPEGSALEDTERVLLAATKKLKALPELANVQLYAGTSAPFGFNGLVRHSYLRSKPELGDLQVNLLPKEQRGRQSHAIALEVRDLLKSIDRPTGTVLKVVEVPPGPPVLATLLAEVYGPDSESRHRAVALVKQAFRNVEFVVDIDDTIGQPSDRLRIKIDNENLEFHGVEEIDVYDTIKALIGGVSVGYSHRGSGANPIEIAVKLPKSGLFPGERLLSTPVPAKKGVVELGDLVQLSYEKASFPIFRRDGRFAEMVMAELAGSFEAPVYGMLAVEEALKKLDTGAAKVDVRYRGQPEDESVVSVLWDGEWEITYTTFRDMGMAFAVALLGIYLLVVAQFKSFRLPLVILMPVPLTLVGVVLGHWLFNAPFSATSMIGFIALAGIVVRNSILLVDFIRGRQAEGKALRDSLLEAGTIRFKPIFLTAIAAMVGAVFILLDPIFQGLAISMLFGLASSTALTLLVIPAIYILLRDDDIELSR